MIRQLFTPIYQVVYWHGSYGIGANTTGMMENVRAQVFTNNIEGPKKNEDLGGSFRLQMTDEKIVYNMKLDDAGETRTTEYAIYGIDIYKPFDENERYD